MRRALREKLTASAPVAAVTITDQTAPAVTGYEPRQFRSFVAKHKLPHLCDGRRLVVRTSVWLEAIERLEAQGELATVADADEPDAGTEMLRRIGRVRSGGAR